MMNRKLTLPILLVALALVVMAAVPQQAAAELMYDVIPLGALSDGRGFQAIYLNDRGEVAGYPVVNKNVMSEGYVWRAGQWTELVQPINGVIFNGPKGLNNRGQILGNIRLPDGTFQSSLWENSVWNELPPFVPNAENLPKAMNDLGDFVGESRFEGNEAGWVYRNGQAFKLEPILPGGVDLRSFDINNRGVVIGQSGFWIQGTTGYHAVRWVNGQVQDLGTLDPTIEIQENFALSINDHEVVVGVSNGRPFVWKDGVISPLLLPNEQITKSSSLFDINNAGTIVGTVDETASSTADRNVLWDSQGQAIIFDNFLEEHFPNWQRHWINAINNDGWVLGGGYDASSEARSFLLIPIPQPSTWTTDSNGNWSQPGNWNTGVPNAVAAAVLFADAITAPRTVSVDVSITVGRIAFDSPNPYTIAGPGILTLDAQSGAAAINVVRGSHTISAPLTLADNTVFTVSPAGSTLAITGALSSNAVSVTKSGAGTLTVNNIRAAALTISGGTVAIQTNNSITGASMVGALVIAGGESPTARLDLNNNAAIINYTGTSPVTTVRQQILAGRGGAGLDKPWNGQGITSSAAAAENATQPESRSIGYAKNSALPLGPYTTYRGQPVDDTSLLIAYTRTGDANLDGLVNDDDVTIVGAAYAPGVPQPSWALGDFDYNGFVDDDDVTLLGAFYDPSAPSLIAAVSSDAPAVAPVPEPETWTMLACGLAALSLFARRRSRNVVISLREM